MSYFRQKKNINLLLAFFIPIFVAALFRFWDLELRPFHPDEGVNTHFLLQLYNNNYYHYNPANYHGPFLYYIGLIPFYIFGISDFSFRLMPVLFGIMSVALLYPLRRRLGLIGLITVGLMIAISPANSYFARDTIHETYLIFFTLATVVSFFQYSATMKSRYIYFGATSLAFTITVKETYIITFAIFAISLIIAYFCEWIDGYFLKNKEVITGNPKYSKAIFTTFVSDCREKKYAIGISVGVFLLINFLFYSSFFTYYDGVKGILSTLKIWTETGIESGGGHAKPFIYYFTLIYKYELPMLVLGVCGFYYAFRYRGKFDVFAASWAIFVYLIYSFIPYKTPWLVVNILLPLSILTGIFIKGIFENVKKRWHYIAFFLIYVPVFGIFCYQSIMLNFFNFDDERCELIYVQTKRDIYNLLDTIEMVSESTGKDVTINVLAESYWPLPWYLREYKNVHFWGKMIGNPSAPVILVDQKGDGALTEDLKGGYVKKLYVLRPGNVIIAYIQKSLYNDVYGGESGGTAVEDANAISFTEVVRGDLDNGLSAKYYYSIECAGEPFLSRVQEDVISFSYMDYSKKPYMSPFGILWEGYLDIKQKGLYQFATKSDDGSNLYIDGNLIVKNGGFHATLYVSGTVFLNEGVHSIKVDYFDGGGGAAMELLWTKPGGKESLLPGEVMFHRSGD